MKIIISALLLLTSIKAVSQIILSHNVGNTISGTTMYGCSNGNVYWGRTFSLENFGVENGNDFTITLGEVAIMPSNSNWDCSIEFNIYSIDDGFPETFNETNLLGKSQTEQAGINGEPITILNFDTPVIVPHNVRKILVEVHQLESNSQALFCSDTEEDNDIS